MSSWMLLLAPALLGAAEAPLPTPAQLAARAKQRGDLAIDLAAEAGVKPGVEAAARNRRAIQNAADAFSAASFPGRRGAGVLRVPPHEVWIDGPIFLDQGDLTIEGVRTRSSIRMAPDRDDSCFYLGIPRKPRDQELGEAHWFDLHGLLDATAAPKKGMRWGLKVTPEEHIAQGAGPFSFGTGDFWGKTRQLTIEFACDLVGSKPGSRALFGMSNHDQPQPWHLFAFQAAGQPPKVLVRFRTADGTLTGGTLYMAEFAAPMEPRLHRIAVQVDLVAARVTAYVDGRQVEVKPPSEPGFKAEAKLHFASNQNMPFLIGTAANSANMPGSDYLAIDKGTELTLAGLRLSNALRYADEGPGKVQRRLDGARLDDLHTYFDPDAPTVAFLPLDDHPAASRADRHVTVRAGPAAGGRTSSGLWLSPEHGTPYSSIGGITFRDVEVGAGPGPYGEALTLGYALFLTCERSRFLGGAHGIGSWNWGANYVTRLRDCDFGSLDAAIYNHYGMIQAERCNFWRHGRSTIWIARGGVFQGRDLFCSYPGEPETIIRGSLGAEIMIDNLHVDIEAGDFPSVAGIYAETSREAGTTHGGRLDLRNVYFGTIGRGRPFLLLHQAVDGDPPAPLRLDGLTLIGENYKALVEVDGPAWNGEVRTAVRAAYPPVLYTGPRGGRVISRHAEYTGPPRRGTWTGGAHVLEVAGGADGQYTEWRCAATGTYGTADPPRWTGLNPLDAGRNGLAAYFLGLAALATAPDGAVPPNAPTYHLALSTAPAGRPLAEPAGQGYARVPIAASGWEKVPVHGADYPKGVVVNAAALRFPKATGAWGTVRSVHLMTEPKGGKAVGSADLTIARTPEPDAPPPAFAPRALWIARD